MVRQGLIGQAGGRIVAASEALVRKHHKSMTQTTNRFLDELAKLMTDAAGAAQGLKRDIDGIVRSQAERFMRDMDVVQREEFEAVKAMAERAREENERLEARIAALEEQLKTRSA